MFRSSFFYNQKPGNKVALLSLSNDETDEIIDIENESNPVEQPSYYLKVEECIAILEKRIANVIKQNQDKYYQGKTEIKYIKTGYWASFIFTMLSVLALPVVFDIGRRMRIEQIRSAHEPIATTGDSLALEILYQKEYFREIHFRDIKRCAGISEPRQLISPHENIACLKQLLANIESFNDREELQTPLQNLAPIFYEWMKWVNALKEFSTNIDAAEAIIAVFAVVFCIYMIGEACFDCARKSRNPFALDLAKLTAAGDNPSSVEEEASNNQKLMHMITLLRISDQNISMHDFLDHLKKIQLAFDQSFLLLMMARTDTFWMPMEIIRKIINPLLEDVLPEELLFMPVKNPEVLEVSTSFRM